MATGWNPRDSALNLCEIEAIASEIHDVEAKVRKAEAAVEQATHYRNEVRATLRETAKKMQQPNLSEQERAALVAEQQLCSDDLTAAEKDLERLSRKEEQLRKEKEQLRKEKEQLREEKLQQDGVHARGRDAELQQHDQRAAVAELFTAEVSCSRVMRLVDMGETVGSCCLVSNKDQTFLLTARHCMDPKPGEHIKMTSFTVCGHRLRHLASFPRYDITVLLLDGSTELPDVLKQAVPFKVDGGMGLMLGVGVMLIGFPLAADKTIKGFEASEIPLFTKGRISWIACEADEAIGSYTGAFPNSSGGAVTFGPPFRYLAGMHTGILWHEQGTNPRDTQGAADQDASGSSSSGAQASASAAGSTLVVETDKWSADKAMGRIGQAAACHGNRKRKPASQQEGVARDCDVQYCLDNVGHKSCMGMFVPAHVLVGLLNRCHELLAAARGDGQGY